MNSLGETSNTRNESTKNRKVSPSKNVNIQNIRFDKKSHCDELKNDDLASVDDVVECDVVMCRRNGTFKVEKMKIIQRRTVHITKTSEVSIIGTIKEIAKNFGLISILDVQSTTASSSSNELIYFPIPSINNNTTTGIDHTITHRFRKGEMVQFDIGTESNGKRVAMNIVGHSKKRGTTTISSVDKNVCLGIVLLEPSHTTRKNVTPTRKVTNSSQQQGGDKTSRWESVDENRQKAGNDELNTDLGCIILTSDPTGAFRPSIANDRNEQVMTGEALVAVEEDAVDSTRNDENDDEGTTKTSQATLPLETCLTKRLRYKTSSLSTYQPGAMMTDFASTLTPHRGDLVSFVKGKNSTSQDGNAIVREVRMITRGAATLLRGRLQWISDSTASDEKNGTTSTRAQFHCDDAHDVATSQIFDVPSSEIISCDPSMIKDQERVEGILYEGKIYGIARLTDLYIGSKFTSVGPNSKGRQKLNLTVKKDLGGKIVAQSMMAKGPDGTKGFVSGWTARISRFDSSTSTLKLDAPEFTPSTTLVNTTTTKTIAPTPAAVVPGEVSL
jgi:hypothetical protein